MSLADDFSDLQRTATSLFPQEHVAGDPGSGHSGRRSLVFGAVGLLATALDAVLAWPNENATDKVDGVRVAVFTADEQMAFEGLAAKVKVQTAAMRREPAFLKGSRKSERLVGMVEKLVS
jgi:hypothetical protein